VNDTRKALYNNPLRTTQNIDLLVPFTIVVRSILGIKSWDNLHKFAKKPTFDSIMKQVILNIPDSKYAFFIELVNNLGLEKVEEATLSHAQKVLNDLEEGFREVKMIEEGKMKGTPLNELLDEL